MDSIDDGFSGRRAAEIVGITYRQLDYWARTDLIRPSLADANGSGSRRKYSYRDLLELKVVKNLLDAGIRLESVRDAFAYLRDHLGEDVSTVNLVISGRNSVLVRSGEELVDLVRQGQGVLNILPLGGVKDEIDAAIVELPSEGTASSPVGGRLRPERATVASPAAVRPRHAERCGALPPATPESRTRWGRRSPVVPRGGGVQRHLIASLALGPVEGGIGRVERRRRRAGRAVQGDTDRDRRGVARPPPAEQEPLRRGPRLGARPPGQHDELVAAVAGDVVGAPHVAEQVAAERLQHLVAGPVPQVVVDRLEVVEVHDQQRIAGPEAVEERVGVAPVAGAGQLVAVRGPVQPVDELELLQRVADLAGEEAGEVGRVAVGVLVAGQAQADDADDLGPADERNRSARRRRRGRRPPTPGPARRRRRTARR